MPEYIIRSKKTMRGIMVKVWEKIGEWILSGPILITITRLTRNKEQNAKFHAMIGDISKTVTVDGERYSLDVWKALLIDDYEQELSGMKERLTHPSRVVISLDGMRAVTIRASSTKFRVFEASGFIQYLYAKGTEYGAVFSEKSLAIYEEYKEAK